MSSGKTIEEQILELDKDMTRSLRTIRDDLSATTGSISDLAKGEIENAQAWLDQLLVHPFGAALEYTVEALEHLIGEGVHPLWLHWLDRSAWSEVYSDIDCVSEAIERALVSLVEGIGCIRIEEEDLVKPGLTPIQLSVAKEALEQFAWSIHKHCAKLTNIVERAEQLSIG